MCTMSLLLIVCLVAKYITIINSLNCTANKVKYEFHKISTNQKSFQTIIAVNNSTSIEKCAEFTKLKGGLAFNYATHRTIKVTNQPIKANATISNSDCEVLYCPEIGNYAHMINDTEFDYYSLYSNLNLPQSQFICEPTVGVFKLYSEHKNYTNALKNCEDNDGTLADVLSSDRTNILSKTLLNIRHAWIGLRELDRKSNYVTSRSKTINCYQYRAWHPGHPKNKNDLNCVALTNSDSWKTMDCGSKLPYICEFFISKIVNNLLN